MSDESEVLRRAAELRGRGERHVLVTVVAVQGSTPRNPGAKMLWCPDGDPLNGHVASQPALDDASRGRWFGTVGGGQFERLVQDDAERHMRAGTCGVERYVLGADADQCCGGVMEVFIEAHGPRHRVVLFGAGHVSLEVVRLLQRGPVEIVLVDDRADWNSIERFPRARRVSSFEEGVRIACAEPASTLACVMTCSHDTDFELLRGLLPAPPAFVGLIGSRSKRACLLSRLVASGLDEERVRQVRCPIGVGDTGKEPSLVAISIAAQVLIEAKALAPLRS